MYILILLFFRHFVTTIQVYLLADVFSRCFGIFWYPSFSSKTPSTTTAWCFRPILHSSDGVIQIKNTSTTQHRSLWPNSFIFVLFFLIKANYSTRLGLWPSTDVWIFNDLEQGLFLCVTAFQAVGKLDFVSCLIGRFSNSLNQFLGIQFGLCEIFN